MKKIYKNSRRKTAVFLAKTENLKKIFIRTVELFWKTFQPSVFLKLLKTLLKIRKTNGLRPLFYGKTVENSVESYKNSFKYQIQTVICTLQILV